MYTHVLNNAHYSVHDGDMDTWAKITINTSRWHAHNQSYIHNETAREMEDLRHLLMLLSCLRWWRCILLILSIWILLLWLGLLLLLWPLQCKHSIHTTLLQLVLSMFLAKAFAVVMCGSCDSKARPAGMNRGTIVFASAAGLPASQ